MNDTGTRAIIVDPYNYDRGDALLRAISLCTALAELNRFSPPQDWYPHMP